MARRATQRMRLPDRRDEPAAGIPEDAASPRGTANARRAGKPGGGISSGGLASRRVAAAAAAAGAAVAGLPNSAEVAAAPTGPQSGAEPMPAVAAEATNAVSPLVLNAQAEAVSAAVAPAGAAEAETGPDSEAAPVSAAVAPVSAGVFAAASAVNAAIAATVAARASHHAAAGASAGPGTEAALSAMAPALWASSQAVPAGPAQPPVTVQGYRRPPAKDSPSIIRAHLDEPESFDSALSAAAAAAPSAADDSNRRYMRRSEPDGTVLPDVPGITRAAHDLGAQGTPLPPPLFSNEGIVRRAEAQHRSRFLGPVGGLFAALLGAGDAFGHTAESSSPEMETLVATAEDDGAIAGSPDFLPSGNPRRSRKRRSAAMLAAAALIAALFVVAAGAAFLPTQKVPVATATPGSSPTSPGIAALDSSLAPGGAPADTPADDPTDPPSGLLIGDDPLPPGATRKPVVKATPAPTAPAITAGPSPTATHSATPRASAQPSHTPTPTPTPTHTPTPTPTPTRTPVPTPTPTPVMFAEIGYVQPPAFSPANAKFAVGSLPGASCKLSRLPVTGDNHTRQSNAFFTGADGWAYVWWGSSWSISSVMVTIYATCTAASPDTRTAQSANVNALWPPKASPSPSAT